MDRINPLHPPPRWWGAVRLTDVIDTQGVPRTAVVHDPEYLGTRMDAPIRRSATNRWSGIAHGCPMTENRTGHDGMHRPSRAYEKPVFIIDISARASVP